MADGILTGHRALSEMKPVKSSKSVAVLWQEGVCMGGAAGDDVGEVFDIF